MIMSMNSNINIMSNRNIEVNSDRNTLTHKKEVDSLSVCLTKSNPTWRRSLVEDTALGP